MSEDLHYLLSKLVGGKQIGCYVYLVYPPWDLSGQD